MSQLCLQKKTEECISSSGKCVVRVRWTCRNHRSRHQMPQLCKRKPRKVYPDPVSVIRVWWTCRSNRYCHQMSKLYLQEKTEESIPSPGNAKPLDIHQVLLPFFSCLYCLPLWFVDHIQVISRIMFLWDIVDVFRSVSLVLPAKCRHNLWREVTRGSRINAHFFPSASALA